MLVEIKAGPDISDRLEDSYIDRLYGTVNASVKYSVRVMRKETWI